MDRRQFLARAGLLGLALMATSLGCTPVIPAAAGGSDTVSRATSSAASDLPPVREAIVGTILLLPFRAANSDWLVPCEGQGRPISSDDAASITLFGQFGMLFGGNGSTTFNLPDLRNKVPGMTYHMVVKGIAPSDRQAPEMQLPLGATVLLPYSTRIKGLLPCDGSTFRASEYPQLAALLNATGEQVTLPKPAVPVEGMTWAMAAERDAFAYLGTVLFVPNAPNYHYQRGFERCDGRLLAVNAFNALYTLVGTRFGAEGTTKFKLPDLTGAVPADQLLPMVLSAGVFPPRF
jgi:microcystin-dependent protein